MVRSYSGPNCCLRRRLRSSRLSAHAPTNAINAIPTMTRIQTMVSSIPATLRLDRWVYRPTGWLAAPPGRKRKSRLDGRLPVGATPRTVHVEWRLDEIDTGVSFAQVQPTCSQAPTCETIDVPSFIGPEHELV